MTKKCFNESGVGRKVVWGGKWCGEESG